MVFTSTLIKTVGKRSRITRLPSTALVTQRGAYWTGQGIPTTCLISRAGYAWRNLNLKALYDLRMEETTFQDSKTRKTDYYISDTAEGTLCSRCTMFRKPKEKMSMGSLSTHIVMPSIDPETVWERLSFLALSAISVALFYVFCKMDRPVAVV
jgi:hypothetical protein